jgi:levanase/levanbiose-producing levanase
LGGGDTDRDRLRQCGWLDWGRDYYAAVSFNNAPDGRRLMIGWLNNWDYANSLPTSPWRSGMSLVREVSLETAAGRPRLVQTPVLPAAGSGNRRAMEAGGLSAEVRLPEAIPGTAQLIDAEILPGTAAQFGFRFFQGTDGGAAAVLTYDAAAGRLTLDRREGGITGFHPEFPSAESAPVALDSGVLGLRIVVDHCSVEVFAQGGKVVLTDLVFPPSGAMGTAVFADGGTAVIRRLEVSAIS